MTASCSRARISTSTTAPPTSAPDRPHAGGLCLGHARASAPAGGSRSRPSRRTARCGRIRSGREIGFARRLTPTEAGAVTRCSTAARPPTTRRRSISTWSRPCRWTAPCLPSNAISPVQAAEIRHDGGAFWGVQYHPEFSLSELAAILGRRTESSSGGFLPHAGGGRRLRGRSGGLDKDPARFDLAWRHGLDAEVLDPARRTREIRNFIEHRVAEKSARGRA